MLITEAADVSIHLLTVVFDWETLVCSPCRSYLCTCALFVSES